LKFSYNWISELVEGLAAPPQELGRLITMKTAECESVETLESDSIIEVDNKSITHRPDLWGHLGLAREVAAITGCRLLDPVKNELLPQGAAAIEVAVEDFALCPRYSALAFENVTVQPSPPWLQKRLASAGLNPINNIVDVTNYVMAELAQPLHAFDWDLLRGPGIMVRRGRSGERVVALNEQEYAVDARDLLIADERGPIAIAGVIGGLDTAIGGRTRRVILESACFQAASIRKTSMRQKLRTDASMRFEKAQDPYNTVRGLARALELFMQVSPGIRPVGGVADAKRELPACPIIRLPLGWLFRKLGRSVEPAQVARILEALQFQVEADGPDALLVTVPSWRATRDVSLKDDLVEEVGRMIGYDSITPVAPLVSSHPPPDDGRRARCRSVCSTLIELGFTEVYNYSFVNEDEVRALGMDPEDHVRVANPISADQSLLRRSLLPGIRRNLEENSKHFERFRLFETGREIHKRQAGLPEEKTHVVAAVFARDDGVGGLMEAKRAAEHLLPGCEAVPAEARCYEHPARAAEVVCSGEVAGRLFELHPSLLENGRAAILDLDMEAVGRLSEHTPRYVPIRRFPASAFDLSVVAGLRELVGDIRKKLSALAGADLVSIEFLRQYAGPPLPEGAKSVSYRLTVGAPDRTLSSEEVSAIRARIIDGMRQSGYELRV